MGKKSKSFYLFFAIFSTSFCLSAADSVAGELTFIPKPDVAASTLIYYNAYNESSVRKWASIIDGSLDKYYNKNYTESNIIYCTYNSGPVGENVCDVSLEDFHPCRPATRYNYGRAAPCVFFKLNEVLDWKPEPYNNTRDLPQDMPEDLRDHIKTVSGKPEANSVWITCKGENPADIEYIGPVKYLPQRGFPTYYYPFTNQEGYLSPLVAVLFERLRTNILINIECRVWARNIVYDRSERRGSVHFELMVDG